jgi:fatty-acyl-CoA synthase
MTELSPLGVTAPPGSEPDPSAGRLLMGLDVKLTDADGVVLPRQHGLVGHLKVKGPGVVDRYFGMAEDALDEEGFCDTGDLASIDAAGNLTIRGRSKDLIKSGGEWINPAEIEAIIGREPMVDQAAVIARADGKWGERPVLVVEPRPGATLRDEGPVRGVARQDRGLVDARCHRAGGYHAARGHRKDRQTGLRAAYAAGTL